MFSSILCNFTPCNNNTCLCYWFGKDRNFVTKYFINQSYVGVCIGLSLSLLKITENIVKIKYNFGVIFPLGT